MERPYKIVDTASGLVILDGLEAVAWKVLMKASVPATGVLIKHIAPGQLYTFIFQQDDEGGHRFAWPATVHNPGTINRKPDAVSVQNYIGSTGGVLYANLPGT